MRRFLAVLLAAGLVLGACGGDGDGGPDPADDPKGALINAFENLAEYEGTEVTLTVDSTPEDLAAVSEGSLTDEQADLVLNSSVVVKGAQGDSPEDAQVEFIVDIDGSLIEIKAVDKTLYARGDVRDLVDKFGGSQEEVDAAVSQVGAQYDFVRTPRRRRVGRLRGSRPTRPAVRRHSHSGRRASAEVRHRHGSSAVEESSTVTDEGSEDPGQHLVANVNIRDFYTRFQDSLSSLGQLPGAPLPSAEEIPDQEIAVDFWVDDGNLTQVGFDFLQVAEMEGEEVPEGVDQLGLLVQIEEFTDGIEAPDAAATVNLQELMGGLMGGLGGLGGDTGGRHRYRRHRGHLREPQGPLRPRCRSRSPSSARSSLTRQPVSKHQRGSDAETRRALGALGSKEFSQTR